MTIFDPLVEQWGGRTAILSTLGNELRHGRLPADTVAAVVDWADLDELLGRSLIPSQVQVVDAGRALKPVCYLDDSTSLRRQRTPLIDADKLTERLGRGATLVINEIDEQLTRVHESALDLADLVGEHVQTHVYATWGHSQAFDAHWDPLDVLVVQVHGEKQWDVYGLGKVAPLSTRTDPDNTCPETVHWSGRLRPGDVLYLPRGWWHAVRGVGVASLHLSYGFQRRTGLSYLTWLTGYAKQQLPFRSDLPGVGGAEELAQHQKVIADCLHQLVQDHPLDEYLREYAASVERPARLRLADLRPADQR
jgi:ribosomal protein L16 Arg81 hydroxylase